MRRCIGRLCLAGGGSGSLWQPTSTSQYLDNHQARHELNPDDVLQPQLQKKQESRFKGHMPLSLKTRMHLSDISDEKTHHVVDNECFGQRLDEFLQEKYPEMSYDAMKKLVENGHIYRYKNNGKKRYTKVYDRLELDELVVVPTNAHWKNQIAPPGGVVVETPDEQAEAKKKRQRPPISSRARQEALSWVLFKNEHVIVIDKPAGVAMTGSHDQSSAINISDLLPAWKYTNEHAPFICNYLDRETSGIVVLARNREAHRMMARMFMRRVTPNNVYWGFVTGRPNADYGRIRMHCEVRKGPGGNTIIARPTPTEKSKVAIAEYVVNANAGDFGSFVSFYPLTNRTHQMRIMAAHGLRTPLFGDAKFGGEAAFPQSLKSFWDPNDKGLKLHLHHRKIQLPYKHRDGTFVTVTAPLPKYMQETFKKLGWPTEVDDPLIPG